jgi:cytochrome bd-type quinol oxidase subunit 1
MKYIFGILGIIIGTLMVIYTEWIVDNFGRSPWAERHLSTSGGSRLLYKLLGLAAILLALMMMTGQLGDILLWFFGGFF